MSSLPKPKLKGQMGMMEYIMLTFFIMVIVIVLIFFLGGWQMTQVEMEKIRGRSDKALALMKEVSASPLLVRSNQVFDDTKLMVTLERECSELEDIFGADIFFEVTVIGCNVTCNSTEDYPGCCSWSFCKKEGRTTAYDLPVNVYRKLGHLGELENKKGLFGTVELASLTAGVYYEID